MAGQALRATRSAAEAREERQRAESLATAAEESAAIAEANAADVLRLSDVKRLRDLETRTAELWPAVPEKSAEITRWLDRASLLATRLPGHESSLEKLSEPRILSASRTRILFRMDSISDVAVTIMCFCATK